MMLSGDRKGGPSLMVDKVPDGMWFMGGAKISSGM